VLYTLWDSSVVIPYYIPEASRNGNAATNASIILDSVRHHRTEAFFYLPNIVAAEVFAAFDREFYSGWDPQIHKKYGGPGRTLHGGKYKKARKHFRKDIHNGVLFYQLELNRYHILALDLIAPIDKYRKFYRTTQARSMGASDLLIGAMAMHLVKLHGRDNVRLLTADRRMKAIFELAGPAVHPSTRKKMALPGTAKELGFGTWSKNMYPRVLDLERCTNSECAEYFGEWPLSTRKTYGKDPKA